MKCDSETAPPSRAFAKSLALGVFPDCTSHLRRGLNQFSYEFVGLTADLESWLGASDLLEFRDEFRLLDHLCKPLPQRRDGFGWRVGRDFRDPLHRMCEVDCFERFPQRSRTEFAEYLLMKLRERRYIR